MYNIFSIKRVKGVVTRKFQFRYSHAKQRQRNEPKKCAAMQVIFLLPSLVVVAT